MVPASKVRALFRVAFATVMAVALASCDKLSFNHEQGAAATVGFGGVQSIKVTPDGHYVLGWNFPSGATDISGIGYEIYLDKWTTLPSGVDASATGIDSASDGVLLGAKVVHMPDGNAPVGKGVLLDSVKGVRSYTLVDAIQPNLIYAFQVRAIQASGNQDKNDVVLVYSPAQNNLAFNGASNLALTGDGKLLLSWDPPVPGAGTDPSTIAYDIYLGMTQDPASTVIAGSIAITSLGLSDNSRVGSLVQMAADKLPAKSGAPIAEVKGSTLYQVSQDLSANLTYLFQVQAKGPKGESGASSRVIVYRPTKLQFAGLPQTGAVLAPDRSSITLTWSAATGNVGPITYVVYGDANFTQALATTKDPTYTFQNVTPGKQYTFAVRAKDGNGSDNNSQFAIVTVPSLTFAGLQSPGVALAADNSQITLTWPAASNSTGPVTYVIYQDPNFTSILDQTSSLSYVIKSPLPGSKYVLGVRAKDQNGSDANTSVVFVPVPDPRDHTPPTFAGLVSATTMSNSKILLTWKAATDDDLYQYNIYQASDLTKPIASTPNTSYVVGGLNSGVSYSFVVRAIDVSGNQDTNTVAKLTTTLSYVVPDFAGIASVAPLGGTAGLTGLTLSWAPAGGAVTGYQVFVATSAGDESFTTPASNITGINTSNATVGPFLPGATTSSATVTGLTSGTTYYFVVRAFYLDGGGNVYSEVNQIEKSSPTNSIKAPTFAGATSAIQGSGLLALSTATVSWGTPQSNGVWDGFQISYELGTCAQPFSSSPTTAVVGGSNVSSYTATGLTANTTYRFMVRTSYSPTSLFDSNTGCATATTTPTPPTFAGVSTVTDASGISGFTSLNVTWPQATGSFSYYLVEWSANSSFAPTNAQPQITTIATTSITLTGLPTNTKIYVRVSAVFTGVTPNLSAGAGAVLSATTTPPAPSGEGLNTLNVASSTSLGLTWTAPTNAGAVYNGYDLWRSCSATASSDIISAVGGPPYKTFGSATLAYTDSGLSSNTQCCYQIRAYYNDGTNTLASTSTTPAQCATPTLVAPTFAGVQSATNPNTPSGFSQLTVAWNAISASDQTNFSYYEVAWATTTNGQVWGSGSNIQVTNYLTTSTVVTGLADNTTYYFRVRAVNATGSPVVGNGANAVVPGTTTPLAPTGDALNSASPLSQTSITLNYTAPSATANTGGLYNGVFLFVYQGTSAQVVSYQSGLGTPISGNITATTTSDSATFASAPTAGALIQVPMAQVTAGAVNTFTIAGLNSNQQVCVEAVAVYWVSGQAGRYLVSSTPSTKCTTPTAAAPTFAGVTSLAGFADNRDFTQIATNWGSIAGACTGVDVSISTVQATPDFTTGTFPTYKNLSCALSSVTVAGLSPYTTYYIQVRAKNVTGGTTLASGAGAELSRATFAPIPTGDSMTAATFTVVAKAADHAALTWTLPTSGYWNQISIWKATGSSQSAAQTAALAAAATLSNNSGPTTAPFQTFAQASPASSTATTYTDTVSDGVNTCYVSRAVYTDGTYYLASGNTTTQCGISNYTAPTFSGVATTGSSIVGTWSDGSAKIKLNFGTTPAGSIEEFWIYSSTTATVSSFNLSGAPWQIVDNLASNSNNPSPGTISYIYAGGQGVTPQGNAYFIVRYKHYGGPDSDSNSNVSNLITVPASQANSGVAAASSASILGSWSDGTAKIKLNLAAVPSSGITTFNVYFSNSPIVSTFDFNHPWQVIAAGNSTYDLSSSGYLYVGAQNRTFSGSGYFVVREIYTGDTSDANTVVSSVVTIPTSQANYVYVSPSVSRLGYGYYIGAYEAAVASGAFTAGDVVTATETSLVTCSNQFHGNGVAFDSSCGTAASSATIKSVAGVTPTQVTWHQAFVGCRNSSGNGVLSRLPTEEEWRRASRWKSSSYATMWSTYSGGAGNCNTATGALGNTGASAACSSNVGAYDMAGNSREWVDQRMTMYDVSANGESRFSYGPQIGRLIANGIDTQASAANSPVTRRYFQITPGANNLALLLGSDYATSGYTYQKQYDAETETWQDPTVSTTPAAPARGFRCVAFPNINLTPSMQQLAQLSEPTYASGDNPGGASPTSAQLAQWKIPENFYVKDVKPETLTHTTTGTIGNDSVTIAWSPWTKQYCNPSCSSEVATNFTYYIYRYVEPTAVDIRTRIPWAVQAGSYATLPSTVTGANATGMPVNPLATDNSGNLLCTAATTPCQLVATIAGSTCNPSSPSSCSFTDSNTAGTGFSPKSIYDYVMVVADGEVNYQVPKVQRYRSPYFAGDPSATATASFRTEQRFRRAADFLVDETYQQSAVLQVNPQIMVHVPMDVSGADHDFFIQKYEASSYSGSAVNNSPAGSSNWPLQANGSGIWQNSAGSCQDTFLRTATFGGSSGPCGNGSNYDGTTAILQSKQGTTPFVSVDQGAFWAGCRNTGIKDGGGNTYYEYLPSDAEWFKAADWGDVNQSGYIYQGFLAAAQPALVSAQTIATIENGNGANGYCNANSAGASTSAAAGTQYCRSRYGAADMVGSVWEWTTGQIYNGTGYDNGTDGLWLGQSFLTSSNTLASFGDHYDFLRAYPASSGKSTIVDNGDYYWYSTGLMGSFRGGSWGDGGRAGRWYLALVSAPSTAGGYVGGRCAR